MKGGTLCTPPGMVCYAEKQEKLFWFSSLGQIVQLRAIIFCRTFKNYFGQFVWIEKNLKKSHYNSRVSLHEAPTKNDIQKQKLKDTYSCENASDITLLIFVHMRKRCLFFGGFIFSQQLLLPLIFPVDCNTAVAHFIVSYACCQTVRIRRIRFLNFTKIRKIKDFCHCNENKISHSIFSRLSIYRKI